MKKYVVSIVITPGIYCDFRKGDRVRLAMKLFGETMANSYIQNLDQPFFILMHFFLLQYVNQSCERQHGPLNSRFLK